MGDLARHTVKNWRWWVAILPMSIAMLPLVALDVLLRLWAYCARESAESAEYGSRMLLKVWTPISTPVRRWAYKPTPEGDR